MLAVPLLILLFGFFIGLARFRSDVVDELRHGAVVEKVYVDLWLVQEGLFDTLCRGRIRVQDCSLEEKVGIFRGTLPPDYILNVAGWMEMNFNCNGYRKTILSKYSFSDATRQVFCSEA